MATPPDDGERIHPQQGEDQLSTASPTTEPERTGHHRTPRRATTRADRIVYASGAWRIAGRADDLGELVIGLVDRETLLDVLAEEQDTDDPQPPTAEWAAEFAHDQLLGRVADLLEGGYPYDDTRDEQDA